MPLPVLLPYHISPLSLPGYGATIGQSLSHGPPVLLEKLSSDPVNQQSFVIRGLPNGLVTISSIYETGSPTQDIDGKLWANPSLLSTAWSLEMDSDTQSVRIHQTGSNLVWKASTSETATQILLAASSGGSPKSNPDEFWTLTVAYQQGETLTSSLTPNVISIRQIRPYVAPGYCVSGGKTGSQVDLASVETNLSNTQIWYFLEDQYTGEVAIRSAVTQSDYIETSGHDLAVSSTLEKWKLEPSSYEGLFRIKAVDSNDVWHSPVPISFNHQISVGPSAGGSTPDDKNAAEFWFLLYVDESKVAPAPQTVPTTGASTDPTAVQAPTSAPSQTPTVVKSGVYSIQSIGQSGYVATMGEPNQSGAPVITAQLQADYPIAQLFEVKQVGSKYTITSLTGAYAQGSGLYVYVNANLKPTYWTFEQVNGNFIIKLEGTSKVWSAQKPPLQSSMVILTDEEQGQDAQQWTLKTPIF